MSASTTTDPSLVEALLGTIESLHASLEQEQAANSDLHADMKRLEEGMGEIKKAERDMYTVYLQEVQNNNNLEKRIDELELERVELKREIEQSPYLREMGPRYEEQIKQLQIDLLRATTSLTHARTNLEKADQDTLAWQNKYYEVFDKINEIKHVLNK